MGVYMFVRVRVCVHVYASECACVCMCARWTVASLHDIVITHVQYVSILCKRELPSYTTLMVMSLSVDLGMFRDTLMWAPESSWNGKQR